VSTFTRALLRPPGPGFERGLTRADLGTPDLALARRQHEEYARALEQAGLQLVRLPADEHHPDSTFVEDTAVLLPGAALMTLPGAESRRGEVPAIRAALEPFFTVREAIHPPGTLDAGDVCVADGRVFIGLSERTNEEGTRQLSEWLENWGHISILIDVRDYPGLLHLKSGLAYLGGEDLVASEPLADHPALRGYRVLRTKPGEEYGANCLALGELVLIPSGHPRLAETLERAGYRTQALELSEFRKLDGGLSCLSLRF